MSTVKTNNVQIGQALTASQNFTWYQPATPDGTVRLGNGNSGSVTDLVTLTSAGNLGIGTSSPGAKLDVAGNANIKQFISAGNGTTNGYLGYSWNRNLATGALFDNAKYAYDLIMQPGTNTLSLEIYAPGGSAVTGSALVVDSSGNLGLGVTPSAWSGVTGLQINSYGALSGSGTFGVAVSSNLYATSSGYAAKYIANDYASFYAQRLGQHQWYTAPSGTAGNAISFTQAMTLDASGNLLVGTTSTTGYGNFANALQSATVSANSNARSFDSTYRVAASNNATVDVWFCRDANGSTFGNNSITGHFYIYVVGANGGNAYSAVYSLVTTGNGTSQATLTAVSSVTRGTSPVLSVAIANDGVSGAVKLQITYINNSGVVTGGNSNVVFKGLVVP